MEVTLSCGTGNARSCITGVLDGIPEHRDSVLTAEEKAGNDQITLCCSRAKSPASVLDPEETDDDVPSSASAARRDQPRPTPGLARCLTAGLTRANGEPLLADSGLRDGLIAAIDPKRTSRLPALGPAGALTLPGLVEPHAHLDKTFTIERCRPAAAGCWRQSTPAHEGSPTLVQGGYSTPSVPPRWLSGGAVQWRDPLGACHVDGLTPDAPDAWQEIARLILRRHHPGAGWRWSRCPCFRIRWKLRPLPARSPTAGALPAGRLHPLLQLTPPPWKICCAARPAGIWIWICILMRSSAEVSQGLTSGLADHLSRHPFPGISAAATAARWPLAATNRRADPAPAGGARRHPLSPADDQPVAAGCDASVARRASVGSLLLHEAQAAGAANSCSAATTSGRFLSGGKLRPAGRPWPAACSALSSATCSTGSRGCDPAIARR